MKGKKSSPAPQNPQSPILTCGCLCYLRGTGRDGLTCLPTPPPAPLSLAAALFQAEPSQDSNSCEGGTGGQGAGIWGAQEGEVGWTQSRTLGERRWWGVYIKV